MIYFTSDTHFGHDKDFIYGARGYSSYEEHDRELINKWNEVVSPDDEVYHLGDFAMGNNMEYAVNCINKLNGKIHLIRGNHDTEKKCTQYQNCKNIQTIKEGSEILRYNGYELVLSHYPTLVSNYDDKIVSNNIFSLHGHTHSKNPYEFWMYRSINIAVDAHDNRPISIEEIMEIVKMVNN